jgi:hypothetical protein
MGTNGSEPHLPTTAVEVDVTKLDNAVSWLTNIQKFVETYCIGYMPDIAQKLNPSQITRPGADVELSTPATFFGGFYSARGMQVSHDNTYNTVNQDLRNLAEHLGKMADATKTIIKNYKTAEEQNKAAASDINKILDDGRYTPQDPKALASTGNDPTTTTTSTTTTTPKPTPAPSPTATPTTSPTAQPKPTTTSTPSPSPGPTATPPPTATPTATPTASPTATPTATPTTGH